MGFNLKVLLHVAGILLTVCLLSWCVLNTSYYATMLTLTLILGLQIASLLRYVSATNRELSRFLAAVKYADFSQSFRGRRTHSSFRELGEAFDGVIERFRSERGEKEAQAVYLQAFVQQLPIAVFALHEDGRIAVANQAFLKFMGGRSCHHLDHIREFDNALGTFLDTLRPGRDQSFKLQRGNGAGSLHQDASHLNALHLKVSCTLLRLHGQQQKLVSIQDISSDLESQELQAWQNLIRVMTHEIMNSITPITSLADTARQYITEAGERLAPAGVASDNSCSRKVPAAGIDKRDPDDTARAHPPTRTADTEEILALLEDAASAATTIGKRGQGLMRFVQSYRTLSRLPAPRPKKFRVKELLAGVVSLMAEQAATQRCGLNFTCIPETLELQADQELLEQALINLVKNGLDAVAETPNPLIRISAELRERGQVNLTVTDNGCGIERENLDNIFVPFFTTKRGGNGIGMTIVRQIVTLNNGTIRVNSHPGQGTAVLLSF